MLLLFSIVKIAIFAIVFSPRFQTFAAVFLFKTLNDTQAHLQSLAKSGKTIGFVPTMGALHKGHISLIQAAKKQCDIVTSSIFVNPTQFNEKSDLDKYPRTLESDMEKLESEGTDILFSPDVAEVYPKGMSATQTWDFGYLTVPMEGANRPGHFEGVAQVVHRLLEIVQPDVLFMGQKDYQQLAIIARLLQLTNSGVKLVGCPTVREEDGLAMSSRNVRLAAEDRPKAVAISKTLRHTAQRSRNEYDWAQLEKDALAMLKSVEGMEPEYFEIVDAETLQKPPANEKYKRKLVACTAAWLGGVRLIDNMFMENELKEI